MALRTLYIATSNPGKLRDFAAVGESHGCVIAPMPCLDRIPPPPEDQPTFEGNARAKAIYYSRLAPGYDILADDSGLEVDALNGAPGVRSARYAADSGFASTGDPDQDNNLLLLRNLAGIAADQRTARYRCVLALANGGECLLTAEGSVEGCIASEPKGSGGFGYDPLFYLPDLGKTMAEICLETKNSLSHRGQALRELFDRLRTSDESVEFPTSIVAARPDN
jgi:XTP/dITP diphosphohydrolase